MKHIFNRAILPSFSLNQTPDNDGFYYEYQVKKEDDNSYKPPQQNGRQEVPQEIQGIAQNQLHETPQEDEGAAKNEKNDESNQIIDDQTNKMSNGPAQDQNDNQIADVNNGIQAEESSVDD